MMPMDPKKLINRFSWKRSQSAVFSHLHRIHFADIWLVSAYTVTLLTRREVESSALQREDESVGYYRAPESIPLVLSISLHFEHVRYARAFDLPAP